MAEEEDKKLVKTIDMTPTWLEIHVAILAVITDSDNPKAVQDMRHELRKMAILADERNAMVEQGFPPAPVRELDEEENALLVETLRIGARCAGETQKPIGDALEALAKMVAGEA